MSVIKKQTLQNTVIDYIGIGLGFVNMSLLFPFMLSQEELGLRGLIITLGGLGANFSSLGIGQVLIRFFPFFKTEDKKHNDFLNLALIIPLFGFVLLLLLCFILENQIIIYYQEKSALLIDYFPFALFTAFGFLYARVFSNYMAILLKTVVPNFLKHVALRLFWLLQVLLFHYGIIDFSGFVWLLSLSYFLQAIGLLLYGIYLKQVSISFKLPRISRRLKPIMISYALFAIATGYIGMIVASVDQLMIASMIGTAPIAIYSIAIYLNNVMMVPGRSLQVIANSVISYNLKQRKFKEIGSIYKKSAINMGVSGAFVFLLIWVNIDSYITILPIGYEPIKYVLWFLGIGKLIELGTGTNTQIISLSKHYRFNLYSALILIGITIGTNLILIPKYELIGAACATAITLIVFNTLRMFFLKWKMDMWPYSLIGFLKLSACILPPFAISFFFVYNSGNIYLDIPVNTVLYTLIFGALLLLIKPSEDIHLIIVKHWKKYVTKK